MWNWQGSMWELQSVNEERGVYKKSCLVSSWWVEDNAEAHRDIFGWSVFGLRFRTVGGGKDGRKD